jgi:hypothetical protein
MGGGRKVFLFMEVTLLAITLIAMPADLYAASQSRPTAVPIQDVHAAAGRWFGLLHGRPGGARGLDWFFSSHGNVQRQSTGQVAVGVKRFDGDTNSHVSLVAC